MATRVLHLTDTHLCADRVPVDPPELFSDAVALLTGHSTHELFELAVGDRVAGCDLVLHTGDLVDVPTSANYEAAFAALDRFGTPFTVTPGNHDDPGLLAAGLDGSHLASAGHHDVGAWRVVLVDSTTPGGEGGTVRADELDRLGEAATAWPGPVLVAMHHPPIGPCSEVDCRIDDPEPLFERLHSHPNVRAVATGHVHQAGEDEREGVRYLRSPSTALQLEHVHPLRDHNRRPTRIGVRTIDLHDDGTLTTDLHWT